MTLTQISRISQIARRFPALVGFAESIQPDSKHELRWSAVAGLCGAVLSMVVIFVYSLFDVTIYDKKKIEDSFNIPVLGIIPKFISEEGKE